MLTANQITDSDGTSDIPQNFAISKSQKIKVS